MAGDFKLTQEDLQRLREQETSQIAVTRYDPCLCGKLLDAVEWTRRWHSGVFHEGKQYAPGINYSDILCEDCRKEFKGWPRIVCLGCKRLMGFFKPGKQSTGFEFKMGGHYHIADCPQCNPKARATSVLEHEQFCRVNRIKTRENEDLLQEIEIKRLQGEKEAETLRKSYEASKKP